MNSRSKCSIGVTGVISEEPGSDATAKPTKKRWRWLRRSAIVVLIIGLLTCPWPSANRTYIGSDYQEATLLRLQEVKIAPTNAAALYAGIAEVDISPPAGHPLAGFGARRPKGFTRVHSPCFARALTLAQNGRKVTILTADILVLDSTVASAILGKVSLPADEVYFTASHTHSGPGGFSSHFAGQVWLGKYSPEYFEELTTKLAEAITQSRMHLIPVEMGLLKIDVPGQRQAGIDQDQPTYDKLSALIFREVVHNSVLDEKPLAVLVSFGAHATILGHHSHFLSSDYPGALAKQVKLRTNAEMVCFAAGALADARPNINGPAEPIERIAIYAQELADKITDRLEEVKFERDLVISNIRLTVDLPPARVAISPRWRLSPLLTFWIPNEPTYLHLLRIGSVVMVGFPADYSGGLALELDDWCSNRELELVPTSFNGDWRGYFVSSEVFFKYGERETRDMNFFGPWIGEYFNDLAKRVIDITITASDPGADTEYP